MKLPDIKDIWTSKAIQRSYKVLSIAAGIEQDHHSGEPFHWRKGIDIMEDECPGQFVFSVQAGQTVVFYCPLERGDMVFAMGLDDWLSGFELGVKEGETISPVCG